MAALTSDEESAVPPIGSGEVLVRSKPILAKHEGAVHVEQRHATRGKDGPSAPDRSFDA